MQEFQLPHQLGRHVPNQTNYVAAAADHHPQCFHSLLLAVDGESDNVVAWEASGQNGERPTLIANCGVDDLKRDTKLIVVF